MVSKDKGHAAFQDLAFVLRPQLCFSSKADFCLVSGMCCGGPEGFAQIVPILSGFFSLFWGRGQAKSAAETHIPPRTSIRPVCCLTSFLVEGSCSLIATRDRDFGLFCSQPHPSLGRHGPGKVSAAVQVIGAGLFCHVQT